MDAETLKQGRKFKTHMLADHIKPQLFQNLQIVCHGLPVGRSVYAVWPKPLVQSAKLEDKFAVQNGPLDAIHVAFGNSAEPSITLDLVAVHIDGDVVQVGRVRRPQFRRINIELHLFVGSPLMGRQGITGVKVVDNDLNRRSFSGCTMNRRGY